MTVESHTAQKMRHALRMRHTCACDDSVQLSARFGKFTGLYFTELYVRIFLNVRDAVRKKINTNGLVKALIIQHHSLKCIKCSHCHSVSQPAPNYNTTRVRISSRESPPAFTFPSLISTLTATLNHRARARSMFRNGRASVASSRPGGIACVQCYVVARTVCAPLRSSHQLHRTDSSRPRFLRSPSCRPATVQPHRHSHQLVHSSSIL